MGTTPVTYITALYNIARESVGDGRKWESYLAWFKDTLKHNAPMIVYVPPELADFALEHRPAHLRNEASTWIVVAPLEVIPYYKYHEEIQKVLASPEYQARMRDPKRIECYLPLYTVIQYSKFPWLTNAVRVNPFNSEQFFWIDAGFSRFYEGTAPHLTPAVKCRFVSDGNCANDTNQFVISATPNIRTPIHEDYIWDNNSRLHGSTFGGTGPAVLAMAEEVNREFERYLYQEKVVNNEQILLLCIYKNKPYMFCPLNNPHLTYPYTAIPRSFHPFK
jgi:hypothetical protein